MKKKKIKTFCYAQYYALKLKYIIFLVVNSSNFSTITKHLNCSLTFELGTLIIYFRY